MSESRPNQNQAPEYSPPTKMPGDNKEIVKAFINIAIGHKQRTDRLFSDVLPKILDGEQLTEIEKNIILKMQEIVATKLQKIKPLNQVEGFNKTPPFPPFPSDENQKKGMMTALAEVYKDIASDLNEALGDETLLTALKQSMSSGGGKTKDQIKHEAIQNLLFSKDVLNTLAPNTTVNDPKRQFLTQFGKVYNAEDPAIAYRDSIKNDFIQNEASLVSQVKQNTWKVIFGDEHLQSIINEASSIRNERKEAGTPNTQTQQPAPTQQQPQPEEPEKRKKIQQLNKAFASFKSAMPSFKVSLSSPFSKRKSVPLKQTPEQTPEEQQDTITAIIQKLKTHVLVSGPGTHDTTSELKSTLLLLLKDPTNGTSNAQTLIQEYRTNHSHIPKGILSEEFWVAVAQTHTENAKLVLDEISKPKSVITITNADKITQVDDARYSSPTKKPSATARVKETLKDIKKDIKEDIQNTFKPGRR